MAQERKVTIYKPEFFKKLPAKAKEHIYTGTIELLKGYLSFDSTMVAGTGGGAGLLAGRIATMWGIYPALMSLCVEILKRQDLLKPIEDKSDIEEGDIEDTTNKGEVPTPPSTETENTTTPSAEVTSNEE